MNGKTFGIVLLCASMALAQGPGGFARQGGPMGGFGRGGFGAARVVTGAPYSAVEVRQFEERLGDGNMISRTSETTLYRDSLGRTRTEIKVTPPVSSAKQPYTLITISDPVKGERYVLDSSTMTFRTSRIPKAGAAAPRAGRGNAQARPAAPAGGATAGARAGRGGAAITTSDLGSQVKNGTMATGTRATEVIPAGRIGNTQPMTVVRETWYSAEIKRPVEVKILDPQRGNSTTELTNLVVGEPSASLFAVPAGYTEKAGGRGGRGGAFNRGGRPQQ